MSAAARERARAFCDRFGLRVPVLMGPMAGSSPVALALAVAAAGGLGACGAVLMDGQAITDWAREFRAGTDAPVQINLWIPDAPVTASPDEVAIMRGLLDRHGAMLGEVTLSTMPDFAEQCAALVATRVPIVSSIMGLYPPDVVAAFKRNGMHWFANVSCLDEARAAEAAGADAVVVSGIEAGGHRSGFTPEAAEHNGGTVFALVPLIAQSLVIPVIAAGGIADGRALVAALTLGASAVQIGTALLRAPEAGTAPAWSAALARTQPEDTVITRAFSGRPARAIRNAWTNAASAHALPYPLQRQATAPLRTLALTRGDADTLQMWAGQRAAEASDAPAEAVVRALWDEADALLA